MSALLVRPARPDDLEGLMAVAAEAGTGMTTVPNTEEAIMERIEASLRAFSGAGLAAAQDIFFFVLEDSDGPVGMASIFPDLGADRPFYSYRLSHIAAHAPDADLRATTDVLYLVNDFHGYAEVGTLLVGTRARGQGAGRLLSLSRFMFMGTRRDRFGDNVMAEIRGWFEPDGSNPFWDHIAAKFFHTSFEEADRLSAHDFRFISHLMPKFPIYVSLLPEPVQEIIGKAHETSRHAKGLLESEGFRWSRCIDIFDGGPSLESAIDQVRTIRTSSERTLTLAPNADHIAGAEPFLITTSAPDDFVTVLGWGHRTGGTVVIPPEIAERANLRNGSTVIAAPLKG